MTKLQNELQNAGIKFEIVGSNFIIGTSSVVYDTNDKVYRTYDKKGFTTGAFDSEHGVIELLQNEIAESLASKKRLVSSFRQGKGHTFRNHFGGYVRFELNKTAGKICWIMGFSDTRRNWAVTSRYLSLKEVMTWIENNRLARN